MDFLLPDWLSRASRRSGTDLMLTVFLALFLALALALFPGPFHGRIVIKPGYPRQGRIPDCSDSRIPCLLIALLPAFFPPILRVSARKCAVSSPPAPTSSTST